MNSPAKYFLGWDQNPIHSLGNWLRGQYSVGEVLRLERVLIVLPSLRGQRHLLDYLAKKSQSAVLPQCLTPAGFVSHCTQLPNEASEFECLLSFKEALAAPGCEEALESLLSVNKRARPLNDEDYLALAQVLLRLHKKLESHLASDKQKIVCALDELGVSQETEQWASYFHILNAYHATLADRGFSDAFSAERLQAFREPTEFDAIILCGCWELSPLQKALLEKLRDRITLSIFAPPEMEAGFGEFGDVVPAFWLTHHIDLESLRRVHTPSAQSLPSALISEINEVATSAECAEIGICLFEQDTESALRYGLQSRGFELHSAKGKSLSDTLFGTLLYHLFETFLSNRYEDLLSLLQHPLSASLLAGNLEQRKLLAAQAIAFRDEALPLTIPIDEPILQSERYATLRKSVAALLQLKASFTQGGIDLLLEVLIERLQTMLEADAAETPFSPHELQAQFVGIEEAFRKTVGVWKKFSRQTGSEVPPWLLRLSLTQTPFPAPRTACDIDSFGWLETPWDKGAHLFLVGANTQNLPEVEGSSFLLYEALAEKIGVISRRDREARDKYLVALLLNSRLSVSSITSERNCRDEKVFPSALLMPRDVRHAARHVLSMSRSALQYRMPAMTGVLGRDPQRLFQSIAIPATLSATAFRDYLFCPFHFYLKHILKLEAVETTPRELDALQFGNLIHALIEDIITDPTRESTFLDSTSHAQLQSLVFEKVSSSVAREHHPAILVQRHSIVRRLECFLSWLRMRRADGWERLHSEWSFEIVLPETVIPIKGRIDYIERKRQSGEVALIDFKTNEIAKKPEQTHLQAGRWQDLQLPLYRYAAEHVLGFHEPILAFVNLSGDSSESGFAEFTLTDEDFHAALEKAAEVEGNIRAGAFWPPSERNQSDLALMLARSGMYQVDSQPAPPSTHLRAPHAQ